MELNLEQCPLCGTELSGLKFKEIQAKLRREEQEKAAELTNAESALRIRFEQQFNQDLEKQRVLLEKKAQKEAEVQVKKIASERDEAAKKLQEAEAREAKIREQAQQEIEKERHAAQVKAKAEASDQISKLALERDQAAAKLKQAETRETEIRKETAKEIEKQKQAAELKAQAEAAIELKKLALERDQASAKAKASVAREAEIRKAAALEIEKQKQAADAKAQAAAAVEIKKLALERDQATAKANEAESRIADAQKQVMADAEKLRLADLAQQRQALENDKKLAVLKERSESNRKLEAAQKKLLQVEKQLQNKTANELGDGPEIDLYEVLRETFPTDKITRIRKGQPGADILHEIFYKGTLCGKIILESKNRQDWKRSYVAKLRQDQVEEGAEHAILATTSFPPGKKEMCIESDVIVISPARVEYITHVLRSAMVNMHVRGLSMKERSTKMAQLYKLITSESYSRKLAEAGKLAGEILELDVQEKTTHDNVWKKRGSLAKRVQNVLREAETDVASVIESTGDEEIPPSFGVKSARGLSTSSRTQEIA